MAMGFDRGRTLVGGHDPPTPNYVHPPYRVLPSRSPRPVVLIKLRECLLHALGYRAGSDLYMLKQSALPSSQV